VRRRVSLRLLFAATWLERGPGGGRRFIASMPGGRRRRCSG